MASVPDHQSATSELAAYSDLFDRLSDCALLLDPASQVIIEVNPAAERVLGISREKLEGRSLLQWIDESGRDDFSKALRVAMRRYHPRHFDSVWIVPEEKPFGKNSERSHAKKFTMEIVACPLKLSDNREILQVIARDITFKREAEFKLQQLLKDLQTANAQLEILTTTDGMTGLFNFRHFRKMLESEHIRSERYGNPYGIVFCDIDHFKTYNDKNGHPAGDELLKKFAKIIQACCRDSDLACRYGGEEFVVICPQTDNPGTWVLAERIRESVEKTQFEFGAGQPGGKLTVSVGVSSYPESGKTGDDVVKAADQAVYHSKHNGRNQVTVAVKRTQLGKKTAA